MPSCQRPPPGRSKSTCSGTLPRRWGQPARAPAAAAGCSASPVPSSCLAWTCRHGHVLLCCSFAVAAWRWQTFIFLRSSASTLTDPWKGFLIVIPLVPGMVTPVVFDAEVLNQEERILLQTCSSCGPLRSGLRGRPQCELVRREGLQCGGGIHPANQSSTAGQPRARQKPMSASVASKYLSLEAAKRVEHEPGAIEVSRGSSARGPRRRRRGSSAEGWRPPAAASSRRRSRRAGEGDDERRGQVLGALDAGGQGVVGGNESVSARTASVGVCRQELWRAWRRWSG